LLRQLATNYMQRSQEIVFTIRIYFALVVRAVLFATRHCSGCPEQCLAVLHAADPLFF
jgi:hypothetical protein